ncbi:MAG: sulfite exporter TauE/SafE family protein [Gammaproteobacteria bacterium]|nr:sulfite exporter TauE/SafE family protein [Gammaproteobacteria bacterium]
MPDASGFLIAFSLGLFSTLHCWGMCGGIITALSLGLPAEIRDSRGGLLLFAGAFNLGRVASYTLAGLVAGTAGGLITLGRTGAGLVILQWIAGLVLIFAGLRLAGWAGGIAFLERAGQLVWRRLQPLGRALLPADRAWKALFMGMVWGGLPCGLVYSALLFAMASGGSLTGVGIMLAFGLGTLPGMITAGFVGGRFRHWLHKPYLRQAAGIILIAAGVLVPLLHLPAVHDHADRHDHQVHSH